MPIGSIPSPRIEEFSRYNRKSTGTSAPAVAVYLEELASSAASAPKIQDPIQWRINLLDNLQKHRGNRIVDEAIEILEGQIGKFKAIA